MEPAYPRARVARSHEPPLGDLAIQIYPGDTLRIGEESPEYPGWHRATTPAGHSSWVPETHVRMQGTRGTTLVEFDSRELNVRAGELVTILRELYGWAWVRTEDAREGWVPLEKLNRAE